MAQTAVADTGTKKSLRELARRHGLSSAGALPSLPNYTRQLWSYRHFIAAYANARVTSALGKTRLGMVWQVLTPLINAAVYYVIFGVILGTRGGIDNFIAYLCTGVFIYGFTQNTVQAGIQAITGNMGLIRALHFPRASLPISVTLVEVRNVLASMVVLIAIVLFDGEPITVEWLLIIPILLLQAMFNAGLALGAARLGAKITDLKQLVPFVMRFWMYGSAVLYPVTRFTDALHGWKLTLVEANPLLVFIELMRHALMEDVPLAGTPTRLWIEAVVWAIVVGVSGYVYFWRGEKGYGRG
ncbi:ABC transporter permease [Mangrovihabitans endophyticus]|uniref:Transport permease protein n=1 Tax=Mangrovihabitans endophyticus TaxID=1751298 RepID=A0A8J3C0M1_9ACTN|nr:ABC transporter permease [Mangrovihabitans endophyticus]GGK98309.1 transport permease protein [Mangrovihabitans endophyticus]